MTYYSLKVQWILLIFSILEGVRSECNVNNCEPAACSGNSCNNCIDGYYLSGYTYCNSCPTHCITCESSSSCTACEDGYYGETCSYTCRGQCTACTKYSDCDSCVAGRFDTYCNTNCPKGCTDILCDKGSGQCLLDCIHGYYKNGADCVKCPESCKRCDHDTSCTGCNSGFHGPYCQLLCPDGCLNKVCDQDTGQCTEGCSVGFYQDGSNCEKCPYKCMSCSNANVCTECKTGYWGSACQEDCPITCNRCTQDGICISNQNCDVNQCDEDFCNDNACNKCKEGYYLSGYTYCNGCPTYCINCTSSSKCEKCKTGRYGDTCTSTCKGECVSCKSYYKCNECVPGRYGTSCGSNCPKGCIDILCDKDSGKCSLGCIHGYYKKGEDCQKCPNTCERCSDDTHCTGCVSGYHGNYCHLSCPEGCLNQVCDQDTAYCTEGCSVGYYQDGNYCERCPDRCLRCDNGNICTDCKTGYWGTTCQHDCPTNCNKCTQDGTCIFDRDCKVNHCDEDFCSASSCNKCEEGYYLSGYTYCNGCPSNCINCTSSSKCEKCKIGRYGDTCTSTCKGACISCETYYDCNECVPGRHGSSCGSNCPQGCIDILCDKDSGKCLLGCVHGYYKNGQDCQKCPNTCERCSDDTHCTGCVSGYQGAYCHLSCPEGCLNQVCDQDTAYCTEGCSVGYYQDGNYCERCPDRCMSCDSGNICTDCKTGYWGTTCQLDCPTNCNKCSQNGACISDRNCDVNHCNEDFCNDKSCNKCEEGYYLSGYTYCNGCPTNCIGCTSSSKCEKCVKGRYGDKCSDSCRSQCISCVTYSNCTECVPGRHGTYCGTNCPPGCIDILCDKDTGKCLLGCIHGFYKSGQDCVKCPDNCDRCSDENHCTGCKPGFHGSYCQLPCPDGCHSNVCYQETGECQSECSKGFYPDGNYCEICPDKCMSCDTVDTCTECKTGYWGSKCQYDCSAGCNECTQQGDCITERNCNVNHCDEDFCNDKSCNKCEEGYYLSGYTYCNGCPTNCIDCTSLSKCGRCKDGRHGDTCSDTCRSQCISCVAYSNCTECVPGRHGTYCGKNCPLGCIDILCDKDTGRCLLGCIHGYYRSGYDCITCPENCARCSSESNCSLCKTGYSGPDCQKTCPPGCLNDICDKDADLCTEGCKDGYQFQQGYCIEESEICQVDHCRTGECFGTACTVCEDGYYVEEKTCHRCPDDCIRCSSSTQCDVCTSGKHGTACQHSCSSRCNDGVCSKEGFCTEGCKEGYMVTGGECQNCPENCKACTSNETCTKCESGFWGTFCQYECTGCAAVGCVQTPDCENGCLDGFYVVTTGEKQYTCSQCPGRCRTCTNGDTCNTCKAEHWGSNCQNSCPSNCNAGACDDSSGHCTGRCKNGYYGNTCSDKCLSVCETCENGAGCLTCKAGRYGTSCDQRCSDTCFRDACFRENGTCIYGCSAGYHGDTCLDVILC